MNPYIHLSKVTTCQFGKNPPFSKVSFDGDTIILGFVCKKTCYDG